jgi:uncharacterized protein (TIGR02444 family)
MTEPSVPFNSPFWTFSLRLYGEAGVADACLALQDKQGIDVNLLLFALWAARSGRRLSLVEMRALIELTESWRRDIVVPLRLVRRALSTPPAAIEATAAARLRREIKKAELESERLQQAALFAFRPIEIIGTPGAPAQAASDNVALYATAVATVFDAAPVEIILAALADLPQAL